MSISGSQKKCINEVMKTRLQQAKCVNVALSSKNNDMRHIYTILRAKE